MTLGHIIQIHPFSLHIHAGKKGVIISVNPIIIKLDNGHCTRICKTDVYEIQTRSTEDTKN